MDKRSLTQNFNKFLVTSLLEILSSLRSSYSLCVLCLQRFVVKVLQGFRGKNFLKFLEPFELNSSELWDIRRWFGWFLFKCSSYSKVEVTRGFRFRTWFQQIFYTSESSESSGCCSWCVDVFLGCLQRCLGAKLS